MEKEKILLAGATGYLGQFILRALLDKGCSTRIVVRNKDKIPQDLQEHAQLEIVEGQVTDPTSIEHLCQGIDQVISTVGITKQKDGLTYMQVDYQANQNLLEAAQRSGVRRFIYVSVLNGEKLRKIAIGAAKERFVDSLKGSGMDYCIIRPNAFYSDVSEIFDMAKKGRIYLFGKGDLRSNPIHGADLAEVCVSQLHSTDKEVRVGGPEILTQNELAQLAFSVLEKQPKISHLPDWLRLLTLKIGKFCLPKSVYGTLEFVLTVTAMELLAPASGQHTLGAYFEHLKEEQTK
ncbi:SDR family oxidoreductase [Streptococcus oricebi]|uniref:NAD-dependent dehydratase n=1 Tax=Streptococcus oricebi TaxID=1547447 RepID=A0ABS5B489_9STRE|nr:SDR family oxidoreductase [Streptococcus oricebi]MBP2623336.1 NAD-dependent dehydratase [Streptococcus oricebi]